MTPLLSIIIPTHNRARYALPTIRAMLELSPDIEVVVSDTSVTDELSTALKSVIGKERLKLIRPQAGINVVDNFNLALASATGDYLIFIGDDDLVTKQAVDLARWARERDVDSFSLTFPITYYWPDFLHKLRGNFYAGTIRIAEFSGSVKFHNAKQALESAANQFGSGVLDLPRAYAGMISRSLAERIIQNYGTLFGGVSPDIYSAALIANESKLCVRVDFPIVVPGNSGASTAGQSANGGHIGKLRENAHIGAFENLLWDPLIPEFYSVSTVWSFSLLKALEKIGTNRPSPNFMRLYVHCLLFHKVYYADTKKSMVHYCQGIGYLRATTQFLRAVIQEGLWITGKAFSIVKVTVSGKAAPKLQNVTDTAEASNMIARELGVRETNKAFLERLNQSKFNSGELASKGMSRDRGRA